MLGGGSAADRRRFFAGRFCYRDHHIYPPGETRYELSDVEKIKTVTNYLNHLKMEKNSSVDPEDYDGMISDIQVNYAGGKECMVQHMANQFVRKDGGPWYQLEKEEGLRWDSILEEVSG